MNPLLPLKTLQVRVIKNDGKFKQDVIKPAIKWMLVDAITGNNLQAHAILDLKYLDFDDIETLEIEITMELE